MRPGLQQLQQGMLQQGAGMPQGRGSAFPMAGKGEQAPLPHSQRMGNQGAPPSHSQRVMASQGQHAAASQLGVNGDPMEIVRAVESLYDDRLKPYGRILRKRLAERAAASGNGMVDVDMRHLRSACEACPWLQSQAEDGGDWSVLHRRRQANFVDVYNPEDAYPQKLWAAASDYFESRPDNEMMLPGGRYSCAQELVLRDLPFLRKYSLGQVCHIVQLAISQKKVLGYLNGAVVPYSRSQSMVKERCAEYGRPCISSGKGTSNLANWEAAQTGLREILAGTPGGVIPLSNIKRLFRSRYHLELSETALGHAKLSELLQDEQLGEVCEVRLQGHGYVVVAKNQDQRPPPATGQISLAASLPTRSNNFNPGMRHQQPAAQEAPLRGFEGAPQAGAPPPMPPMPFPNVNLRTARPGWGAAQLQQVAATAAQLQQVQLQHAQLQQVFLQQAAAAEHALKYPANMQAFDPMAQAHPMAAEPDETTWPYGTTMQDQYVDGGANTLTCHNTFIHAKGPPPSPPPGARGRRRSWSLPRNINSNKDSRETNLAAMNMSPSRMNDEVDSPLEVAPSYSNSAEEAADESRQEDFDSDSKPAKKSSSSLAQRRDFATRHISLKREGSDDDEPAYASMSVSTSRVGLSPFPPGLRENNFVPDTPGSPLSPGAAERIFTLPERHVERNIPRGDPEDELSSLDFQDFAGRAAERLRSELETRRQLYGAEATEDALSPRRLVRTPNGDGLLSVASTPSPCRSPVRTRYHMGAFAEEHAGPPFDGTPPQRVVRLADLI